MSRKIAIVTGASRGLGKNAVEKLAKKGVDIILTYHSQQDAAQAVVKSVLELDNWSFYILDREQLRGQKSINLNKLRSKVNKGEAVWVQHDGIADALVGFALERHAKRCDEML